MRLESYSKKALIETIKHQKDVCQKETAFYMSRLSTFQEKRQAIIELCDEQIRRWENSYVMVSDFAKEIKKILEDV